jgi:hypothetical protein
MDGTRHMFQQTEETTRAVKNEFFTFDSTVDMLLLVISEYQGSVHKLAKHFFKTINQTRN